MTRIFSNFLCVLLFVSFFISGSALSEQLADGIAPEFSSGLSSKSLVKTQSYMIATANPHASKAGNAILETGGNAVDAMVAVQLVLGLVEPQSSGLGGGAFLVYWDQKAKKLTTFDGRETAPAATTSELFLDEDGKPLKFFDAVIGGRSVGVPGTVRLLYEVHKTHGKLAWKDVFAPAIKLANDGFEVSERLNALVTRAAESLYRFETTRNYFLSEEGVPLFPGTVIVNKAYAQTLGAIAQGGADVFYSGAIARDIVDTVQGADGNPGVLSMEDMANYQIKEREAICANYRGNDICGMGPPSSGALTIGQILKLIEPYDLATLGPANPESWRLIGDASRLAFADRGRYMADSDFVKMPKGLLNVGYLKERAKLLNGTAALAREMVKPGNPPTDHALHYSDDEAIELPSTSHFSIVDSEGNVVSMTTTIENGFGSRLMVRGFLLNNELTDFSFRAERDGKKIANRVEPGKRPRSSMSPTIIMRDGKPYMAIGSPGGSRIIGYVAKTIIAHLDWGMDVQAAISLPHLVNRFGTYDVEEGTSAEQFIPALEAMGFKVQARGLNSGLHGILITGNGLEGGADPRREGVVLGK
ncbi:MAG: gamma-glutamyltransferase [Rhizobiaceae bacterium]|nr:gamma-glutamyltransferase [Rhizobiaceae bacterium]